MTRFHCAIRGAIVAALATGAAIAAEADWPRPAGQAFRASGEVRLDGRLDEPAWAAAAWASDFTSASAGPENSGAPKPVAVQTRFKVLYDPTALYVGVECDEPLPDKIRAVTTEHDGMVFTDDCIEIFFDPAGDGRYYHHYVINTRGAWYDDLNADYGLVHGKLWDSVIETAAYVDAGARKWCVEVKIPFGVLDLRADAKPNWLWNLSRERYATGSLELSSWSPLKGNFHLPKRFGRLSGVNVEFKRFAWALGEPRVAVTAGASGVKALDIAVKLTNETGAVGRLLASAMLFGEAKTAVSTPITSVAAGATVDLSFPKLSVRSGVGEANCVFTLVHCASGGVLKSTVRRLAADYRPIAMTVLRPCYRNSIYATEALAQIEFQVTLADDVKQRTAAVAYGLQAADGKWLCQNQATPAALDQPLRLPATALADGTYALVATAQDQAGAGVATCQTTLRKLPPPPAGDEVRIDESGNILVNGKPFVGIGWYGTVSTADPRPDVVALQNLQTPVVPHLPDQSVTEAWTQHGVCSFVSVENGRLFYTFDLWKNKGETAHTEQQTLSAPSDRLTGLARQLIDGVRGEPGLIGYYIADEPEINNMRSDYLEAYYKLLCELDPYHPVMVTNDTLDGIVTHGYKCADILGPDPYSPELDYVPNFMKRCRAVLRPGQAIMLTPWHSSSQAHFTTDWGTAPAYPYRVFRNQYLVSLAFGARGWTGYAGDFFLPEIEYRFGLPYVWREVRFLERAMAAPAPATPVALEADAEMATWIRAAGDHLYLVVVNHKPGSREARIRHSLLGGVRSLIVMSEGRQIEVRESGFTDRFADGDARIYTTDPAARDFTPTRAVEAELAQRLKDSVKPGNLLHVSLGARASASDGYYAPWFHQYYYYAINGICDDRGWQASHAGDKPAWLEIALPKPARLGRVVIYTPTLRDYDLQFQGPDGQQQVAEIRGNQAHEVGHNFQPPVECLKLRVTALAPANATRQVSEIEAYEQPGTGPVTPLATKTDTTRPPQASLLPPADAAVANALWLDDFSRFESRDKYYWDGKDTQWVFNPQHHQVTPKPGAGVVCATIREGEGSGMSHIFPYAAACRFFQVNVTANEGTGYAFVNVGFSSSSGKPGYRGAVNTARPGIYTVDTHYIHDSFRSGTAKDCFVTTYMCPGRQFTLGWVRLVRRPEDGLAVTLADATPLPAVLKPGDELLLQLLLTAPATDAVVEVMAGSAYSPVPVNGEPYVQLRRTGAGDGREWAAQVKLGQGTGRFDQRKDGYPVVFRARITGGALKETYASACVSFE